MIEGAPSRSRNSCAGSSVAPPRPPKPQPSRVTPHDKPRCATPRPCRRWIKASSTASAQMKRGTSGGFELALGAQPVSDLVEAASFEVDEARALGDLVMTGLAGLRLRRSRVRSLTGALCGIGGHDDSSLVKVNPLGSGGQPAAGLLYRGQRGFRSRQRSSTHVDAGRLGDDRDQLTGRGRATRARLARRLDPDRQLDQAADPAIRADDRFGRGTAFGRAIASATLERSGRAGAGDRDATFAVVGPCQLMTA